MEWIKIEDKEPNVGQNVIAVGTWYGEINGSGESEYMGLGQWDGMSVQIDSCTYSTEIVEITHWMYIPEHPDK